MIDFESRQFEANGQKYLIEIDEIKTGRYKHLEQLGIAFSFGSSFSEIFNSFNAIYKAVTRGNDVLKGLAKAQEISYNQMHAIKEHDENYEPAILWFCTIFINRPNEDRKVWDKDVARQKIADWSKSDIPINDFFLLAASCLNGYQEAYNQMSERSDFNLKKEKL